MTARVLNGHLIAGSVQQELAVEISELKSMGIVPGLAAVLVGEAPASQVYVRSKVKTSELLGLHSEKFELPASTETSELLALVADLNRRDDIDGILIQLPLPAQIEAKRVLCAIDPAKDVDALHPIHAGLLMSGRPEMIPCTAAGIMEILDRGGIPLPGARAVVIGRSDMVGKPTAMLLLHRSATVTMCHSRTRELASITREADVLVVAAGQPGLVTWEFIKPGATVIDVGINRLTRPEEVRAAFREPLEALDQLASKGSVLVGDVQPEDVREKAGAYTPVPGGVGPLTIAMLMSNTVRAARLRRGAAPAPVASAGGVSRSAPAPQT